MSDPQLPEHSDFDADMKALRDLENCLIDLEDDPWFSEYFHRFNIFDVLRATRTEIRHSNMLAWLLDPKGNHGLGDAVLKGFLDFAHDKCFGFSPLVLNDEGFESFIVQREWKHIDLFISSEDFRTALVIENKVDSGEHGTQLDDYRKAVESLLGDRRDVWQICYILLSPYGRQASDPDNWISMGYESVKEIVQSAVEKSEIEEGPKLLISNYLTVIKEDILEEVNPALREKCQEIYAKHSRSLDLIYDNKPDGESECIGWAKDWVQRKSFDGELVFEDRIIEKRLLKFTLCDITEVLPNTPNRLSEWKTDYHYYFEINFRDEGVFYMWLALAYSEKTPADLFRLFESIYEGEEGKSVPRRRKYLTFCKTLPGHVEDITSRQEMDKALDTMFDQVSNSARNLIKKYCA